jgi:hypothetical protein
LTEALLARDERVAMVKVFHLALLHVARKSDVVMWAQQQAGLATGAGYRIYIDSPLTSVTKIR